MIYAILFVLAIATVHLVSWVGSVLHSVPNGGESRYAVFTFRGDQNESMTQNILMNILFPNIILIFMYMVCSKYQIIVQLEQLFCYVCFYYIYRVILICLILRRRELLAIHYELTSSTLGILIAYFLVKKFLIYSEQIFIPISELVNEFWLVIIILVYKFIVLIFDKIFRQKTIVDEEMLNKYIKNKFKYFYQKYKDVIYISNQDNTVWILLFSIMIFENYNRGKFVRAIERIKVQLGFSTTVGIMQIKSNKSISDEESISLAYDMLKNEIVKGNVEIDDEMQIEYYAMQYNQDEDYAKSISFVYQHLYKYLNSVPQYKHEFYLINNYQGQADKEYEKEDSSIYYSNEKEYVTFDDIVTMSGLDKKQVWKKIKKKKVTVFLEKDEAQKVFKKDFPMV